MNNKSYIKRLTVFTLTALMLVSCSGAAVEPTVTPTIPPSPTPLSAEEILEFAVTEMAELDTYHFTMVIHMTASSGGTTTETPIIFSGDFKTPDRIQGEMKIEMGEFSVETEIISIGETVYIKDPSSGEWQMSTEQATPFNPDDFIGLEPSDIANMVGLTLQRETVLDGVPVYHLEGSLSPEVKEAIMGDVGGENKVAYWIGVEDGWIRQVNFDMEFLMDEVTEIQATIKLNFSEFNKEITIEAP